MSTASTAKTVNAALTKGSRKEKRVVGLPLLSGLFGILSRMATLVELSPGDKNFVYAHSNLLSRAGSHNAAIMHVKQNPQGNLRNRGRRCPNTILNQFGPKNSLVEGTLVGAGRVKVQVGGIGNQIKVNNVGRIDGH